MHLQKLISKSGPIAVMEFVIMRLLFVPVEGEVK